MSFEWIMCSLYSMISLCIFTDRSCLHNVVCIDCQFQGNVFQIWPFCMYVNGNLATRNTSRNTWRVGYSCYLPLALSTVNSLVVLACRLQLPPAPVHFDARWPCRNAYEIWWVFWCGFFNYCIRTQIWQWRIAVDIMWALSCSCI